MQFSEVVQRLRIGDGDTVRQFVAQYEPYIRRTIRRRIARLKLQAAADSADICQSALGSFFLRCSAGEFEFDSPQQMENLVMVIARRKLARLARQVSSIRNRGRNVDWNSRYSPITSSQSDPGQQAAAADLMAILDQNLPPFERNLFARRQRGENWHQIAEAEGESSTLLRKRLSRALQKAIARLELN